MKILVIDDEPIILQRMLKLVQEIRPDSEVYGFERAEKLLEFAKSETCDVAFLDIQMGAISGIEVGKKLKIMNPQINIIFVTGYSEHMQDAFHMRASGYVMKPPTKKKIEDELNNLRMPLLQTETELLTVKCFGNFEVFANNVPLKFSRSRAKEVLAYLVDREGASCSMSEICAAMWEDDEDESKQKNYVRVLMRNLQNTLKTVHYGDVLIKSSNSYAVDTSKLQCDYYDFKNNKPEGVRAYNGEYMSQYSWAELTHGLLERNGY